eukprot:CAMPEP_0113849080 /NCGR_PEP_ID=MMETSP0372-20130328/2887_1 /TAXON_ID=340204 /ORGANISM="Lankesteria abbotti" /LENGTH=154 /DNA_ID=CAMNT_0000818741 /DNA_START=39 /DNA_END=503 /DNA_ORIENTATION=- /assembly_acc=CAM_ASM_000359
MESFVELAPLGLRILTGGSGALLMLSGVYNVLRRYLYSTVVLGGLSVGFGALAVLCEFSPLGMHVLLQFFSFLGDFKGRGITYCIGGFLSLGSEMSRFGQISGVLLALSGVGSLCLHYLGAAQPRGFGYEDPQAAGLDRFADHEGPMRQPYDEL